MVFVHYEWILFTKERTVHSIYCHFTKNVKLFRNHWTESNGKQIMMIWCRFYCLVCTKYDPHTDVQERSTLLPFNCNVNTTFLRILFHFLSKYLYCGCLFVLPWSCSQYHDHWCMISKGHDNINIYRLKDRCQLENSLHLCFLVHD